MHTTSNNIDNLNPTYVGWLGGGRVNAYRALENITAVEETHSSDRNMPGEYTLAQNYPNPFNPSTTISYRLSKSGQVEIKIYNVKGQLVRTLISEHQAAGQHIVQWDGRDTRGQKATSGIYVYQLKTENWSGAKKMVLMR
jgi:flagellar hook assembly protein FlgD